MYILLIIHGFYIKMEKLDSVLLLHLCDVLGYIFENL